MSLKAELDAFRSEFVAHVPPEVRDAMVRADMELAASGHSAKSIESLTALQSLSKEHRGEYHHADTSR